MYFEEDFRKISDYDLCALLPVIESISEEEWAGDQTRQNEFEVHKDTQAIKLIHDDDYRHTNPTIWPAYKTYIDTLNPVLTAIKQHFSTLKYTRLKKKNGAPYFVRLLLARLLPGGEIKPHRDDLPSLAMCHRIHLPIITNESVYFSVGQSTVNLPTGELWEINNRRVHSVKNESDRARVHLIMDYVIPGEIVNDITGQKLKC